MSTLSPEMQRVIDDTLRPTIEITPEQNNSISPPLWWVKEGKLLIKLYNTEFNRGLILWPVVFALVTVLALILIRPRFILINSKISFGKVTMVYILTVITGSLFFYMDPNFKIQDTLWS
jgi:hypothetical protein